MEEFTENTRRIYHRIMEEDGVDRKPGAEELLKYAKSMAIGWHWRLLPESFMHSCC